MNNISVYIASAYTIPEGKQLENVLNSFDVYHQLVDLGYFPYAPLHSHFIHEHHPLPYLKWMQIDYYWLSKCDCVLRLPGESPGADAEVGYAKKKQIPVFCNITEMHNHFFTFHSEEDIMINDDGYFRFAKTMERFLNDNGR
jgi:hypothetical protein